MICRLCSPSPSSRGKVIQAQIQVDKRLYAPLLDDCVRLLRSDGILVAEDTLFPVLDLDPKWHDLIAPIETFNREILSHPDLKSTILPVGDGVTIAVKIS